MTSRKRVAQAVLAGLTGTGWAGTAFAGTVTQQLVVASGTPISATNAISGEVITTFGGSQITINSAGNVAFSTVDAFAGNVSTSSAGNGYTQNTYTLFSQGSTGVLTILAREAQSAPGTNTTAQPMTASGTFQYFNTGTGSYVPIIDNNGDTFVYASLKPTSQGGTSDSNGTAIVTTGTGNYRGLFLYNNQSAGSLVARQNDAINGTNFSSLAATITSDPVVNPSGAFASVVTVTSATIAQGIISNASTTFNGSTGPVRFVAFGGQMAPTGAAGGPAFTGGATFSNAGLTTAPSINAVGQTAFTAKLTGSSVTAATQGVFSETGTNGALRAVAVAGSQVPTLATGDAFGAVFSNNPGFNNAGQTAFVDTLLNTSSGTSDIQTSGSSGTNNNGQNAGGVFAERTDGSIRVVVQRGQQAGGAPTGVVYTSINSSPIINHGGQVAFISNLANVSSGSGGVIASGTPGYNGVGLFSEGLTGTPTLVARAGSTVPGVPADVYSTPGNNFALNASGELLFSSALFLANTTTSDGTGYFAQDTTGTVDFIARTGESFTNSSGGTVTITAISGLTLSGGEDGRAATFNDSGTVPLDLTFSDGSSGIYTFTVAAPEPTAAVLLGLAVVPLLGTRRRRRMQRSV